MIRGPRISIDLKESEKGGKFRKGLAFLDGRGEVGGGGLVKKWGPTIGKRTRGRSCDGQGADCGKRTPD